MGRREKKETLFALERKGNEVSQERTRCAWREGT